MTLKRTELSHLSPLNALTEFRCSLLVQITCLIEVPGQKYHHHTTAKIILTEHHHIQSQVTSLTDLRHTNHLHSTVSTGRLRTRAAIY